MLFQSLILNQFKILMKRNRFNYKFIQFPRNLLEKGLVYSFRADFKNKYEVAGSKDF